MRFLKAFTRSGSHHEARLLGKFEQAGGLRYTPLLTSRCRNIKPLASIPTTPIFPEILPSRSSTLQESRLSRITICSGVSWAALHQLLGSWLPDDRTKADKIMKWFNPAAFTQNAIGTFGNTGIGFLRGAGNFNCDIGAAKLIRFSEHRDLQFRGSFFNAFNHANLGNPNTTATAAAFGRITGASTPRVIEFGLKLSF